MGRCMKFFRKYFCFFFNVSYRPEWFQIKPQSLKNQIYSQCEAKGKYLTITAESLWLFLASTPFA